MKNLILATLCFIIGMQVSFAASDKKEQDVFQPDASVIKALDPDNLQEIAIDKNKPCPDQWITYNRIVPLERQVAADRGATYYIVAKPNGEEAKDELIRLTLGNPYVEPFRVNHIVPAVDDELSIWVSHDSKPSSASKQIWVLGYRDSANTPGRVFTKTVGDLGSGRGLFTIQVKYRNIEPPDHHLYVTIGGPGMCQGNTSCGPEIRSWDQTDRVLATAHVWLSLIKEPDCRPKAEDLQ